MNFFEFRHALWQYGLALDAIDYTAHDKRYHHGFYDDKTMTCQMRDAEAVGDLVDVLNAEQFEREYAENEAKRQYDEVVSQYVRQDGTTKKSWMQTPNGKTTRLTETQWVQVRTPNFKRWFGDWELAFLNKMAQRAWVDQQYKDKFTFIPSAKLSRRLADLLGHNVSEIVITADSVRHMKKHHGDPATETQRGQIAMTADEAVLMPYIMNNFDRAERCPSLDRPHGEKAVRISKRINGVAVVGTLELGKERQFVLTEWKVVSAASMYRASASPWPNVLSDADKERIAKDLAEIKYKAENSSVIVDENGEPMVVFHGSNHTHTEFDNRKSDFRNNTPDGHSFFSDKRSVAASYTPMGEGADVIFEKSDWPYVDVKFKDGRTERQYYDRGGVYSVFLSLKNPLVVDAHGDEWSAVRFDGKMMATNEISAIAAKRGHDGVVFTNVIDGAARHKPEPSTTLVAFATEQVKSATHNDGVFSETDPNINH